MSKINTSLRTHDLTSLLTLLLTALLAGFSSAPPTEYAAPPPPGKGELVINEILYDPGSGAREFVELYNRSNRALDLRSVHLSDSRRHPVPLQGDDFLLRAGAFAVVSDDPAGVGDAPPEAVVFYLDSWPALNNGGDSVILFAGGAEIDSVRYESTSGTPDHSLERIDPYGPSFHPANWAPSTAAAGSTPGRRNTVYERDTAAPELLFAEQSSAAAVTLHFNEPLLRILDRSDIMCSPTLNITEIRFQDNQQKLLLRLSAPPRARRCTISGAEDLSENRSNPRSFALAYIPRARDIAITEVMYEPLADPFDHQPDQPEYLELFNRSDAPLTTTGMYWTDRPGENGSADTTFLPPAAGAIPTGGFAVIFADPEETSGASLRRAFPGPTGPVLLLPIRATSLGLRNDGETIRLHGGSGLIDSLRYDPAWHHPDLIDPGGIALERIAIGGPSNTPDNWSSSVDPTGGTPGRRNSVDTPAPPPGQIRPLNVNPSPFSPNGDGHDDHTVLTYDRARPHTSVRIRIFDARGRPVRTLTPVRLTAGTDTWTWDGRDDRNRLLPAGIYIVLLEAVGGGRVTRHRAPVVIGR